MRLHLIRWAVLVWAGMGFVTLAGAQTTQNRPKGTTLVEQLDQFGRSLFGGVLGTPKEKQATPDTPRPSARQFAGNGQEGQTSTAARAGSVPTPDSQAVTPTRPPEDASAGAETYTYRRISGSTPASDSRTTLRVHRSVTPPSGPPTATAGISPAAPSQSPSQILAAEAPSMSLANRPQPSAAPSGATAPPIVATSPTIPAASATPPAGSASASNMRLHERLSMFREPIFSGNSAAAATAGNSTTPPSTESAISLRQPVTAGAAPTAASTSPPASQPALVQPAYGRRFVRPSANSYAAPAQPAPATAPSTEQPTPAAAVTAGQPTLAPPKAGSPTLATTSPTPAAASTSPPPVQPKLSQPVGVQSMTRSPAVSTIVPPVAGGPDPTKTASTPTQAHSQTPPPASSDGPKAAAGKTPASEEADDALFSRQGPVLSVRTIGPRRISVGKPSTYELVLSNSGQVAADEVIVTVGLPEWAEVVGTEASAGETDAAGTDASLRSLSWKIARLDSKAQERLHVRIVPRQSKPFDLAVRWDYRPVQSQAMIEVQEPKLEMRLEGPRQVLFGQREIYRLELANLGNGDAENLEISLLPLGTGENTPATHPLGTLAAGDKKTIEVELTARQAGTLSIKVDAKGDGGLSASLMEEIAVLRGALKIDVDAPALQFVGANATYHIRLHNSGTAPAANVKLSAKLPLGTKHVSSTADGKFNGSRNEVEWTIAGLAPAEQKDLELVCALERPGTSRLEVVATADGDLTATTEGSTQVDAIADLRLNVIDPSGAVPVGSDAVFAIEVHNRGSKSAEEVEIVAYFSRGVEPVSAEGAASRIAPGQVVFEKIPALAAGQSLRLQIHAKAELAGTHVFRAEVYSKPIGARLISEETTHFYGAPGVSSQSDAAPSDEPVPPPADHQDRTADRRQPTLAAPAGEPTLAPSVPGKSHPQMFNTGRSLSSPLK